MFYHQYERTTTGFVQVWLEVVAINISNMAALVRAGLLWKKQIKV